MPILIDVNGTKVVCGIRWELVESLGAQGGATSSSGGFLSRFNGKKGAAKHPKRRASDSLLPESAPKLERRVAREQKAVLVAGAMHWQTKGFLTAADKKDLGKVGNQKLYALADIVANLPDLDPLTIFVAPLPNNPQQYLICVISNGQPMPDPRYDVTVSVNDVSSTLHHIEQDLGNIQNANAVVIGQWGEAVRAISLAELVEDSVGKTPLRRVGAETQLARNAVILAVMGGAAFYGYGQWKTHQRKVAAAEAAKRQNPVVVYKKALDAAWPTQTWSSRNRVLAVLAAVNGYEQTVAGFRMKSDAVVDCDVAAGTCSYSFERDNGTYQRFADEEVRAHRFASVVYGLDGKTILVRTTLTGLPTSAPPAIIDLPDETSVPVLFWTQMQLLPDKLVVPTLQGNFKLFPSGMAVSESALKTVVRTVGTSVIGPLWGASELMPPIPLFVVGTNYRQVLVKVQPSNTTVEIRGDLYVRKST